MLEWVWPQMLGDATSPELHLARAYANASGDASMGPSWSLSVFLGAPALAFSFLSRQRWLLLASLVFVVLALGSYTPLYELYRAVVLPEQAIRFPERHLAGAIILWSALAGVGLTGWLALLLGFLALRFAGLETRPALPEEECSENA
ncbi:MAG: hypothetical protein GY811_00205 [Myxococcales bacterium]|nr:hypothetical protein [Myxococcales bacterium]